MGKSHLVKVLQRVSEIMGVGEQLRASYLGIAGVNIGGSSICSLLDIDTSKSPNIQRIRKWKRDKLMDFKMEHNVDRISSFVIDEISTSRADIIAYTNERLQEATGGTSLSGTLP